MLSKNVWHLIEDGLYLVHCNVLLFRNWSNFRNFTLKIFKVVTEI